MTIKTGKDLPMVVTGSGGYPLIGLPTRLSHTNLSWWCWLHASYIFVLIGITIHTNKGVGIAYDPRDPFYDTRPKWSQSTAGSQVVSVLLP